MHSFTWLKIAHVRDYQLSVKDEFTFTRLVLEMSAPATHGLTNPVSTYDDSMMTMHATATTVLGLLMTSLYFFKQDFIQIDN